MEKNYLYPILVLVANVLFLITFGISFDYNIFLINIFSFFLSSIVIAASIFVAMKYDFMMYVYSLISFNLIAILYGGIRFLFTNYLWSSIVPSIGYYYIILVGFIISSLIQIFFFLKEK